jgi:hypothetical protein
MRNIDSNELVTSLIAGERLTFPSIRPIEPEVRTGVTFPFCDLIKHGEGKADIEKLLADSVLLGSLVIEWGYNVPFNQHDAFKKWLIDNEVKIANAVPKDVTYRGTYAVSVSSEKHSGLYRTIWGFTTLHALETFGDEMHTGSTFAQLVADLNAFRDRDRGAEYSEQIYQPVRCALRYG